MRIFIEATGSLVSHSLISAIQESGNVCVASDASHDSVGKYIADEFYQVPLASEDNYINTVLTLLVDKNIDMVIPTLDDALLKWSSIREKMNSLGVCLAISEQKTLEICQDKWNTYLCFKENGIPTPVTSLEQEYDLIKPRNGRGGSGIIISKEKQDMTGMISQELLRGEEYTIDVFCNVEHNPVYVVPRKRLGVKEGKSTAGIVVDRPDMVKIVEKICSVIHFTGAVNIQCFDTADGIKVTEINPRIGGGTILGMKATENWINLTIDTFKDYKVVKPKYSVEYGLKMRRYYGEVFYK